MATPGNNKIKIIIVGAGGMGQKFAGIIARHENTGLYAIVDNDIKKAKELGDKLSVASFSKISEVPQDYDAAYVAVPHVYLTPLIKELLGAGKHVLAEKPMALNYSGGKEIVELAKNKNLILMPAYNHRFLKHVEEAKQLIDSGEIGEIIFIRGVHAASGRTGYEKEWRHKKEISGGGVLIDMGVHLIDLSRWFLGDLPVADGKLQNAFWKSRVEDNSYLILQNEKKQTAFLHASWTSWNATFLFEIYGTEGYIRLSGLKKYMQDEILTIAKRPEDFLSSKIVEKKIVCGSEDSLKKELEEFISAIAEKRDSMPSAHDALEVLKIVDNIYAVSR